MGVSTDLATISSLTALLMVACSPGPEMAEATNGETSVEAAAQGPTRLRAEVVAVYPHDPEAYTQGLLWHDGHLYESTGRYGQSSVRRVELESGRVLASTRLEDELFGEGLARIDGRLVQLTWTAGVALIWDRDTLEPAGRLPYEGEGWGLCFDGRSLVMSDGSSVLQLRDPESLALERRLEVRLGDGAVGRLNELECVDGSIYANVFTTDWIVRIDPESGTVDALIEAAGLLAAEERASADVLNGIAWDSGRELFYVTGKLWPKLFAVRFVPTTPGTDR